MARDNFTACMAEIFAHEGGYVDHPKDPGGATNMGITIGTLRDWRGGPVTKQEVRNLTKREAQAIYRARYWNPVRGDDLRHGVDLVALDPAVNSGVSRGVRWLQRAVGATADGKMGPNTLKAANDASPVDAIKRACAARMGFLRGLRTWGTFGRGWSRRVARVEAVALGMAAQSSGAQARPILIEEKDKATTQARRDTQAASGTAAAGGGGFTFADIPEWALIAGAILLALVVINLVGSRRHNLTRANALQQVAEEAKP
jgi:lysozyme family protein